MYSAHARHGCCRRHAHRRTALMALAATGALAFATIGLPVMAAATDSPAVAPAVSGGSADAAQSVAAPARQAAAARARWSAPVPGAPMSEAYGVVNSEYAAGYHTGTDFAVDAGTDVLAVGDGTVVSADRRTCYGNTVVVELPDGRYALYAHLSAFEVTAGQQVRAGQRVARSGDTGNSTGPHLHFEIRTADYYGADIDPLAYLRGKGVTDF
ncbi:murein DD-endopeptidase MepM/ murein hydrolase activator NlpD [Streptomyces sp. 846.5]|nr:M23 family metallopeptidase [Streptomyces sp. 846.5]TDU05749.1 murein DD-endopeptidase MepM/ murein hydrolase activator NlpD [Streptomyces sp. 846.5]